MKTTGTRKRSGSGISDKAIVMEHVSKAYTVGIPALNDVNLHINKGYILQMYDTEEIAEGYFMRN